MSLLIDTNNPVTLKALEMWGVEGQKAILVEECGELVSAISRFNRKRTDTAPVAEEIADVIVSTMSVIPALGIEAEVAFFVDKKVKRLQERINDSYANHAGVKDGIDKV